MSSFTTAISRKVAHTHLLVDKNSPTLFFGAGVVGMVTSTILACRATLKLEEVLKSGQNDLRVAHSIDSPEYSEFDRKRDISIIYVQTTSRILGLYAPAVVVGGVSVAALTHSHNILNRRNAALTAAYAALEKGFNEYRARVVEKYGEEEDRNLRYAAEEVEITDDSGKKQKVLKAGPLGASIYARFFERGTSQSWDAQPEYNYIFLRCQQNYANDLLRARGHVFLNEVYDMLGLERSSPGAVVGWVLNGNEGDNFIDFGIFDGNEKPIDMFVGQEGSILLDFNVDGVIYDKIDTPREALSWKMGK